MKIYLNIELNLYLWDEIQGLLKLLGFAKLKPVKYLIIYHIFSWERRVDPRGRVYYVDHNTRTTTWQRPNPDMMNNLHQWQQWRQNRNQQLEQLTNRFLYPNQGTQGTEANDPLGQLPEGWGMLGYAHSNL